MKNYSKQHEHDKLLIFSNGSDNVLISSNELFLLQLIDSCLRNRRKPRCRASLETEHSQQHENEHLKHDKHRKQQQQGVPNFLFSNGLKNLLI